MTSNAERQRAYRERKRAAAERREFDRYVAAASGPWTTMTDEEKYAAFRRHRRTAKADERRRKKAEAARERRKKRKAEACAGRGAQRSETPLCGVATAEEAAAAAKESRESARRRRRAEAARAKYRRDKLARPPRDERRRPADEPSLEDRSAACTACGRPLQPRELDIDHGRPRPPRPVCRTCRKVLSDENIPRPSKRQYYQFIRYSMWLEEDEDEGGGGGGDDDGDGAVRASILSGE